MLKNKKWLLSAAVIFSLSGFAGASDSKDASALSSLLAASPEYKSGEINPGVITPVPVPAFGVTFVSPDRGFEYVTGKAVEPGSDLSPKIDDQARVKAILKIISDVYNNVQMPYSQDGATFSNREGVLPAKQTGYYREYTLMTGNAPHTVTIGGKTYQVSPDLGKRGSERIVIGGGELVYYTPDHYRTFIQLTVVK